MKYSIEILGNNGLNNIISQIISAVVPILVMIVTLYVGGRRSKKEWRIKESQFKENLEKNENYYQQNIWLQRENNRVSQMPFLFLNQDIKMEDRKGKYTFLPEVTNLGNGTALDINVKFESDKEENTIKGLPFVYKKQIDNRTEIYRYTEFLFTNVLPVNSKASFELLLDIYENGKQKEQNCDVIAGEVWFTIRYKDTYYNEYEQDYMFQYWAGGIGRVESYLPHLLNKSS